jgi:hypothetical protein
MNRYEIVVAEIVRPRTASKYLLTAVRQRRGDAHMADLRISGSRALAASAANAARSRR